MLILSTVKTKDGGTRFFIMEADGRSGQTRPDVIAWFDALEEAALVMRYLKGTWMPNKDQVIALRLIREWDARKGEKDVDPETE